MKNVNFLGLFLIVSMVISMMSFGSACVDTDCDNGNACDGVEICYDGFCYDGTPLVCDDNDDCTVDSCNSNTGCVYDIVDTDGPSVSSLDVERVSGVCSVNIDAVLIDTCSNIEEAEYFVGTCGPAGTGFVMDAETGFDDLEEAVFVNNVFNGIHDGSIDIYVRGKDSVGQDSNWGDCKQISINVDCIPPYYPACEMEDVGITGADVGYVINGDCDAQELLVCDIDPTLSAWVCDDESDIQLAEYFIDTDNPLNWRGFNMTAADGSFYDDRCEEVTAVIDLDNLDDNTHYVKLHAKDTQENWGKFYDYEVSFIKDTTAPMTTKKLNLFDNKKVECSGNEASEANETLINGCYYVKQGTTIELDARDFNPDDMISQIGLPNGYNNLEGEYAGNVVINYVINWRNDTEDSWTVNQSGVSLEDSPVTITLSEDSYHLIEYWATDGCLDNEEDHHFELDIVDTAAPESLKVITGDKVDCSADDIALYGIDDCAYVDRDSVIDLSCSDVMPHPVGNENIYYTIDWKKNWNDEWSFGTVSSAQGDSVGFNYEGDSFHKLTWWCVDGLGNTEDKHVELDMVDSQAPEVNKVVGVPKVFAGDSVGYDFETDFNPASIEYKVGDDAYFVTQDTFITLTCNDLGPHPVKGEEIYYTYYNDGQLVQSWTKYNESFSYRKDTYHQLYYYCEDALGNKGDVHYELDIVDTIVPVSDYAITGPEYFEVATGKTYIDNASRVVLTCDDLGPHPVGENNIVYKYTVDGSPFQDWRNYTQGSEGIHFVEESHHVISYYCVDLLGNVESENTLEVYVDHSKPYTNVSFVGPYYTNGSSEWISQNTDITLTASDDYGAEHDSGVKNTYYKWEKVDDSNCYDECLAVADEPRFRIYEGSFGITEDSCHLIEYYSIDNVDKIEDVNRKCVFVDSKAPNSDKTLSGSYEVDASAGVPSYSVMNENGVFVWKDAGVWHIRWTTDWNGEGVWKNVVGDITTGDDGVFSNFNEFSFDSNGGLDDDSSTFTEKKISFDAWVDGGEDGIDFEYSGDYLTFYFTYDGAENESNVFVGENKVNPLSTPFTLPFTWMTSEGTVALNCNDALPHPVGVGSNAIEYKVYYKATEGEDWTMQIGATNYVEPFNLVPSSYHMIEYSCIDLLENEEIHKFEVDYVDNDAPITVKTVGTPKVACESGDDCDYWVTNETEITFDCADLGEHPVGWDYIEYRWTKDDVAYQNDWVMYNGPFTFNDGDSNHTLEYKCTDLLGNEEIAQVEKDRVDTEGPTVLRKFARVNGGDIIEGGISGDEVEIAIRSEDNIKLCADVVDYKTTGDAGVGINKVEYQFVGLPDPELTWDFDEDAYCVEMNGGEIRTGCGNGECGKWRFEVKGVDLLGNKGEWTNGLEIIVDNVAPVGEVLNPHAGNYYRDERSFDVYAPAVDFGGDACLGYAGGECPASGVDYCEFYAIDYDFGGMNQSEIKECYSDLWTYFQQVGANPNVVPLGRVEYENGVCKGTVALPEDSGMTDTVFLGVNYVDNAGNQGNELFGYHLQLALNPWFSPVTMNIDNEGPGVYITSTNLPGPVTSDQNVQIVAEVEEYGMDSAMCRSNIYADDNGSVGEDTMTSITSGDTGVVNGECDVRGTVPNGLASGNYWVVLEAFDGLDNENNVSILMIVDNDRPTMSVVAPMEGEVYGEMFPVSLNVEDDMSEIANETVMFRISEIPALGNVWCVMGSCEDTDWVLLDEQNNGLYAKTINLSAYDISGQGRYVFDAVACDELYVKDAGTDLGFSLNNDRTDAHCRMISEHGQVVEETRFACDDGIDGDLDGAIDMSDSGCYAYDDDSEEAFCGNDYVEGDEECDGGVDCSLTCEIIESVCDDSDSEMTNGCYSVKINEFVSNPSSGYQEWIELYNPSDVAVNMSGWTLSDGASWELVLEDILNVDDFAVFDDSGIILNNDGDIIKLKDSFGFVVDSVTYGNWYDGNISDNAEAPITGYSSQRYPIGIDSDVDSDDFFTSAGQTPGTINIVPSS